MRTALPTIALVLCHLAVAGDIDLLEEEVRVPRGESVTIGFPLVPTDETTVQLSLLLRMDSPGLGGSMFFADLALNGRPVEAAKSRTVVRLLNRPLSSLVTPDIRSEWYGRGGWRAVYAPDFEAAAKASFYEGNPYEIVLDVTDLIRPLSDNELQVTNTAGDDLARRLGTELDLVVRRATIRTVPGKSPTLAAANAVSHVINQGEPGGRPAAYTGRLLPAGALELTVGDRRLIFESAFSYPNAGLNHLTSEPRDGQPGWRVSVSPTPDGGTVMGSGPDYELRRTVEFTPRRVIVSDTLTNTRAHRALGMMVKHSLSLADLPEATVRLAGNGDPAVNEYHAPANPSVFIRLAELGIGMLCEDDVFRNQGRLWFDAQTTEAGLKTEMLYLPPGESHTLRWSIYPVASQDYYDFVNLVRHDWGSNYTVEGAWCFFSPDQILDMPLEQLRHDLDRLGVRYACSWGGWVDRKADPKRIGFGSEVMSDYWADYRDRLRRAVSKLHEARPDVKALIYFDSQRDTHADATTLYPDSLLTDANGTHGSTEWGGQYSLTWSMVAMLDSSFGEDLLKTVDAYREQIGGDGLYWDEMGNVAYGYPLLTHAIPDGRSCLLDTTTYTVKTPVGITTLLGESHRLAVIEKVRAGGGFIMGNGPAATRKMLQAGVQRMVEIQHNDTWCYEGNLDSPLGYASSRADFGNVTRALEMATLLVGTRLDYPYEISRHLFPFTPIELHHGYLLGEERIITLHSGRYGWPGETVPATLRIFDKEGKLLQETQVAAGPGEARVPIELDEGQVAVMARDGR